MALELGRPAAAGLPLVRLHSECLTGDVFGSQRWDCGPQLREAVERITKHGGYVLYLRCPTGSPLSCAVARARRLSVGSPNRAFWSIAIEAQLYVLLPLLLLLVRR